MATAIEVCDKTLKLEGFKNSSETCKFLKMFNKGFDWLDSKVSFDIVKPAMKSSNKETWSKQFDEIEAYIKSLHTEDPNKKKEAEEEPPKKKKKSEDTRVTTGAKKRGFIGFLINFQSYRNIFRIYVEERDLIKFILGHKLSQERILLAFHQLKHKVNQEGILALLEDIYYLVQKNDLWGTRFSRNFIVFFLFFTSCFPFSRF